MAGAPNAAVPGAGSGYYRGDPPRFGGTGSMAGPKGAGTAPNTSLIKGWTPTVANLLLLVVVEMVAYAGLRYAFRNAHGG